MPAQGSWFSLSVVRAVKVATSQSTGDSYLQRSNPLSEQCLSCLGDHRVVEGILVSVEEMQVWAGQPMACVVWERSYAGLA